MAVVAHAFFAVAAVVAVAVIVTHLPRAARFIAAVGKPQDEGE